MNLDLAQEYSKGFILIFIVITNLEGRHRQIYHIAVNQKRFPDSVLTPLQYDESSGPSGIANLTKFIIQISIYQNFKFVR